MKIDISTSALKDLQEILEVLDTAAEFHKDLDGRHELIEPWNPSGTDNFIDIPQLNVELLRKAQRLKFQLKL